MLIPHDTSTSLSTGKSKNGVVIEIKQIEKQHEKEKNDDFNNRINETIKIASSQITRNKYYKELIDNKIAKTNIIKIPIVFAGKEPYITLFEKEN